MQSFRKGNLIIATIDDHNGKELKMPCAIQMIDELGICEHDWYAKPIMKEHVELQYESYDSMDTIPLNAETFGWFNTEMIELCGPEMGEDGEDEDFLYHQATFAYHESRKLLCIEFTNENGHYAYMDFPLVKRVSDFQDLYESMSMKPLTYDINKIANYVQNA